MQVRVAGRKTNQRSVTFDGRLNRVRLIDQRLLPHRFKIISFRNYRETAAAISDMVVRGAPAIAATAAYGLAQGAASFKGSDLKRFRLHADKVQHCLASARPTAVDPVNALQQVRAAMERGQTVQEQIDFAIAAADEFAESSVSECRSIGLHGAPLIKEGMRVLTHCNAGWLACVDVGTATAPLYEAQARKVAFSVFCDETRPRCQGASLTAWELGQQGIPHWVIADNAAGHLMQRGEIDLVIVGSDRVVGRTGEIANKIGTYTKAVLAKRHGIPFYVAIPFSTIDWALRSGSDIPIEERDEEEVLCASGVASNRRHNVRIAAPGSHARNPGFDVTPAELITGIITPAGIFKPRELWKNRAKLGFAG